MIYCPSCGKEMNLPKLPKFCTYCGADLRNYTEPPIKPTQIPQRKVNSKPSPSYRPSIIIAGCLVIGIIVIAPIVMIFLLLGSLFGPPLGPGIEIYTDADFINYSSSGTGTSEDPYILSNYTLTEQFIGFTIHSTTKHFVITNCSIEICYEGINVENVAPGTAKIVSNKITYDDCWVWETGPHAGITVYSSPGITISNNTIVNAGSEGILIVDSAECHISNNTISEQSTGIGLEFCNSSVIDNNRVFYCYEAITSFESHNVNVTNNICTDNYYTCIVLGDSDHLQIINNVCSNNTSTWYSWSTGIRLETCNNVTIANCTITDCSQGIYMPSSSNCEIYYNRIELNALYGIVILDAYEPAQSNTIYFNSFIFNNQKGLSQASDNGTSNYWYNSRLERGNYWSDWTGSGYYSIAGTANAFDLYPLSSLPI